VTTAALAAVSLACSAVAIFTTTAPAAAVNPVVKIYGDSVVYGGEEQIAARLAPDGWQADFVAYPGVDIGQVAGNLTARADVGDVVVLGVGYTYFWKPAILRQQIDDTLSALQQRGVRRVIWLNVRENRADRRDVNNALNSAARRWHFVDIANWNAYSRGHPEAFVPDGYHLTPAGGTLMGSLMARELNAYRAGAPVGPLPVYGPRPSIAPVVTARRAPSFAEQHGLITRSPYVAITGTRDDGGYWLTRRNGAVVGVGDARDYGSLAGRHLPAPIVGMQRTPSGRGYWLVGSDGSVYPFGDARFRGSTARMRLAEPIVAMAPTPTGYGYWLVASDGGVFSFGDARFYGSTGGIALQQPIVGMASTPNGKGYWLVAYDGGVFAFGDAHFYGSAGGQYRYWKIQTIVAAPDGKGYRMLAANGDVRGFGSWRSVSVPLLDRGLYVDMVQRRDGGIWFLGQRPA
jgi:hypothetical protein